MQDEQMERRLWDEWCFYLSQKNSIDKEDIFSQKVVTLLEKMGWSQLDKELEKEHTIPVGSSQKIRFDILLHQKQNNKSIVIELKQPNIPFNERHREQLFSYMRQVRADVGLLIGAEIEFYYDQPTPKINTNPEMLFKISLLPEDNLGLPFVRLIVKDNYGTDAFNGELQELSMRYREKLKQASFKIPIHPRTETPSKIATVSATGYKGTEPQVFDIINKWQIEGRKKTPWGHALIRQGVFSQAALIDACLCVEGGMPRARIAKNSGVVTDRVSDHIDNDLKIGKRKSGHAAKINVRYVNGETYEYIERSDQEG